MSGNARLMSKSYLMIMALFSAFHFLPNRLLQRCPPPDAASLIAFVLRLVLDADSGLGKHATSIRRSSCLLRPLLPTLIPPVTALFPVPSVFLSVTSKSISAAHGKSSSCETVGEVDLRADGVGEVGNNEDVLDVVVAVFVSNRSVVSVMQHTSHAQCQLGRPWVPD